MRAQKTDLETQREREIQTVRISLSTKRAGRWSNSPGSSGQNTQVVSPIEGRVLEIKVSAGSVLNVGTPVIAIESEGASLEAVDLYSAPIAART